MGVDAQYRQLVTPVVRAIVNIDVPDLAAGERFYAAAWGLSVVRRPDRGYTEMAGADTRLCLIETAPGSRATPAGGTRGFDRHWCPVHLDLAVDDLDAAHARVIAAGAVAETPVRDEPFGRIATYADPFGHGFCLIQFTPEGYDAVA